MAATINSYKGNFSRIDFLQRFAVPDGYQPVFGAMKNIRMTGY